MAETSIRQPRVPSDLRAGHLEGLLAERLVASGQPREYARGQALFVEGDRPERLFVIQEGWILVSCVSPAGRETVLSLAGPGDLMGEVSVLDGQPRSASALALTPVVTLMVPTSVLLAAARDPEVAPLLLGVLAARLREADHKRIESATLDTIGRVSSRLVELAHRFGRPEDGSIVVDLPLSQEQLASWCSSSREATVKALSTLRSAGWISTARRRVVIHDLASVERQTITLR